MSKIQQIKMQIKIPKTSNNQKKINQMNKTLKKHLKNKIPFNNKMERFKMEGEMMLLWMKTKFRKIN